jgi:hypothetical protein
MAINIVNRSRIYNVAVAAGKVSGNPTMVGPLPGVCLNDRVAATGLADVEFDEELLMITASVQGVDGAGNSAVAVGDLLYYDGTNVLNKNNAGRAYGVAFATVGAGLTATINVVLYNGF